ncbi:MAG TPA: ABC transporter permease, partial [Terriglobales bacterium]
MKQLRQFLIRLANVFTGPRNEERLRAEIEEHIALQTQENIRAGMPPTEARRQAVLKFGPTEAIKEAYRDQESLPVIETTLADVKYGLRILRKSPTFALAAIFVLALGIGATTAVFSLVNAVLLRPLPFPHPEQLMVVGIIDPKEPLDWELGDADFLAVRAQQKSFSRIAAWALGQSEFSFRAGNSEPQRVRGVAVTAGFFDTLGIQPELGRNFQPSDDRAEAAPVVMVSHEFWQTQLGGDRNIVGQTVNINGRPRTVAGVMHAGLKFPRNETVDIWTLNVIVTPQGRPPYYLRAFGRLKPGISREQAAQELSAIGKSVQQQYPNSSAWMGQMAPLKERMTNSVRSALWVMLGSVLLVLLIAIANVASLLLARSTVRQREIAVRLALGASRRRIVRQLVTESVLLSAIGGVFGILLAFLAQQAFLRAGDVAKLPLAYQVTTDMRLLLFTCGVSVMAGIVFGLAPAMQVRGPLAPKFQEGTRSTAGAGKNMRRTLVAAEFAIALVLVAGAALLIRS